MKPVFQDIFHSEDNEEGHKGNCLQACIASLLELPLSGVPHFVEHEGGDWFEEMNKWLVAREGLYAVNLDESTFHPPPGYAILNGLSERGVMHSVIIRNGKLVHDPYPGGTGLAEEKFYTVFIDTLENEHAVS